MSGKPSDKRVAVVQLAKAVLEDNPGSTLRRLHYLLCSNADAVAVGYQNTKSDYDSLGRWCTDEDVRFAEVDALSKDILIGRVDDRLQQLVDDNRWKFFGDLETTEKVQIASVLNSLSGGEGTDIRA